ncbi:DUF125-domain-containing protein [Piedraia hortae CBS 480.64]|uniref:DUF125-domain-containing protein n=1 Tax=Piedraia hortae CBS 480.64 TaxID=1314780 RepID=A0A6A7BSA1_9PEZI|nr:DUF125-domain-containing protein [Piedraia hortae CBS 480.64]
MASSFRTTQLGEPTLQYPPSAETNCKTVSCAKAADDQLASPSKGFKARYGFLMRDAIIGLADGLTVPFALTAGLSSLGSTRLVVVGGLAELFAGAISMGLGAYLAAVQERQVYRVDEAKEREEIRLRPLSEEGKLYRMFQSYGISEEDAQGVLHALMDDSNAWVKFMMDFGLKSEEPDPKKAWIEGLVMGTAYFFGGLLPMIPYFAIKENVTHALYVSIGITAVILVAFGYAKATFAGCTTRDQTWSALHTLLVGTVAAGVSYGIVRGVNSAMSG